MANVKCLQDMQVGEDVFQGAPITPDPMRMGPREHTRCGDTQQQLAHVSGEREQA